MSLPPPTASPPSACPTTGSPGNSPAPTPCPTEAAGHTRVDITLGPGCGDNAGAALGLGLRPGDASLSLGTSGVVAAVSPAPVTDGSGLVSGFADATGAFLPLACTLNAAQVLDRTATLLDVTPAGLPDLALAEVVVLGRTLKKRAADILAYFDRPGTSNGPTEAILCRRRHSRAYADFQIMPTLVASALVDGWMGLVVVGIIAR